MNLSWPAEFHYLAELFVILDATTATLRDVRPSHIGRQTGRQINLVAGVAPNPKGLRRPAFNALDVTRLRHIDHCG